MGSKQIIGSLMMLGSVFAASVSQVLLKKSAMTNCSGQLREYLNPLVASGYALLLCTTLVNVLALRWIPLSLASALDASGQIFVPLLSGLVLKEAISRQKLVGMLTIGVGILIFFS